MIARMKDNPINEAAFEWLVRADGGLSPSEQAELDVWLASDNRHYGAYMRAKAVFSQARRAKAFAHSPDPDEWILETTWRQSNIVQDAPAAEYPQGISKPASRRAFLGLAGGVATAGLVFSFLASGQPAEALTFRTRVGEARDVTLEDGSKIALNTDSEIRVLFSKTQRTVELIKGEVLFDIAPERSRPFVVDAIGFQAQAVDTRFAIQQLRGVAPQLIVENGIVDLTPRNSTVLRVGANTRITFLSAGKISRKMLSKNELERELMWREGKISFDDTSLRDAIRAFHRYGGAPIDVADSQLLNQTVTGAFSSDDPMGFAKAVAQVFDLDVVPEGRGIVLRKKD
jgi:transmembrane sensor